MDNKIGTDGIKELCRALENKDCKLTTLNLKG